MKEGNLQTSPQLLQGCGSHGPERHCGAVLMVQSGTVSFSTDPEFNTVQMCHMHFPAPAAGRSQSQCYTSVLVRLDWLAGFRCRCALAGMIIHATQTASKHPGCLTQSPCTASVHRSHLDVCQWFQAYLHSCG